ncbi:MAG: OmpA family protein, partial [Bacteroidota bacterium]
HTGNGAFSPDGQRFYFTRCRPNWQNKTICHIYRSERKNGTWQPPVKLDKSINHPRYTTTHPAVGTEPKKQWEVLYFVSDRPNGKGGLDLWYTVYDPRKKAFRQPRNMGSKINTIRDEVTPYYHNDTRTLYFSSAGHPGMGGLDVFRATGALRKWTPVENLGYPLNSRVDELYYTLSEDRESGFFVSNREGSVALKHATCCDDIFRFELPEYVRIATSGFVHEAGPADSAARVDSTIVHLYLIDPESAEEIFLRSDTADAQGKYFFQLEQGRDYRIATQRSGYYRSEQEVSTRSLIYSDTLHRPIAVRPLDTKPIVLKNIYYEFNKADLTEQATTVLDTSLLMLLQENPELVVEISSHTDSKGTEKYNQYLSQNRAESVVK